MKCYAVLYLSAADYIVYPTRWGGWTQKTGKELELLDDVAVSFDKAELYAKHNFASRIVEGKQYGFFIHEFDVDLTDVSSNGDV